MGIEVLNESEVDVDTEALLKLAQHLYQKLFIHPQAELSVICIDPDAMEQLHLEYMDLPDATDVMSFPMDELRPGTEFSQAEGMLGDIVLCPQVAHQQAGNHGHSTADEMALLLTHGFLHLLGWDHEEAEEKQTMFALQNELLTEFLGRPAPQPTEY